MKILIGGGTGFIGRHLQRTLRKKGYDVVIISRKPGNGKITWEDVQNNGLPAKCSAVVNLAGRNVMEDPLHRWTSETRDVMMSSRVKTTSLLIDAIKASSEPPEVFVGTSAIGYYEPSDTKEYTEESPGGHSDFMSSITSAWEAASEDCPIRKVTVRVGLVLGKTGGLIQGMYWPFYFNLGGPLGSGQQWMSWIHVEDIVGIYTHAIENKHVTGVLNGTAPNPVKNATFTKAFARAMCRLAVFPMPAFMVKLAVGEEKADIILSGVKVYPKRTLESGYKFLYPDIDSACKNCV